MQLDYKDIIIKHYAMSLSGSEIARQTGFSKQDTPFFYCKAAGFPVSNQMTPFINICHGNIPP